MLPARALSNPTEEFERLKTLRGLHLDDEHLDRSLQQIVERVAEVYGTKACMVNLIMEDKQVFQAWAGDIPPEVTQAREMPRDQAICSYVVASHAPLVIEDTQASDEWRDQFMIKAFGVRFYAGVPLVAQNKHALGTLCLMDNEPRTISAEGLETLQMFAARTAAELELTGEHAQSRRLRKELETTSAYAQAVAEFMLALQTIVDVERIGDLAVRTLARAARLDGCFMATIDGRALTVVAGCGSLPETSLEIDPETMTLWSDNDAAAPPSVKAIPLDGIVPMAVLIASRLDEWRAHDQFLLDTIGRATAAAIHRTRRMNDLENAAVTDDLTGLANRRALEHLASNPRQLRDHYRVLLGDLAGFKKVNDQLGHSVGDILLRDVARALIREVRPSDAARVFRYGGDEFVIVLATKEGGGDRVAERLERAVANVAGDYPGLGIRLDLGEAVVPFDASTLDEALRIADSRMYERKRERGGGR
jgi:diguanylate cyclase (GGDEF)-like protein